MDAPTRILIVEDLPSDAGLAEREIKKAVKPSVFECVDTRPAFLKALAEFKPDIVVTDYRMPQFDGLTALKLTLERTPLTPVIVLTSAINEDTAVECMKAGAVDYVIKEHIKRLGQAVLHALEQKETRKAKLQAEQSLREREQLYRTLVDTSPDAIILTDQHGTVTFASPKALELYREAGSDEVIGRNALEWVAPEDHPKAMANIQQILATGHPADREYMLLRKDGSRFHGEVSVAALHADDGRVSGAVIIFRDITDRKQAEEALKKSERDYRYLFNHANDVIMILEPEEEIILEANASASTVYGYSHTELIGMSMKKLTKDVPRGNKQVRDLLQAGSYDDFDSIHFNKKREEIHVQINSAVIEYRGAKAILSINRNITEAKRAEEALRESEARYRALFENSAIAIGVRSPDGAYLEFNSVYSQMLGFTREELLYRRTADITHPEDVEISRSNLASVAEGRAETCRYEKRYLHKNGSVVWGDVSIRPLRDSNGKVVAIVGAVLDITARKRAEEALRALSARHQAILASVPEIITEVNPERVYTWTNPAGVTFFGEDVIGKEAAYYFEGEQGTYDQVQPLFDGSEDAVFVESWQRRKDGEKRLLAWWCRALKDPQGNVIGALSTARDITDQKQAEVALMQSEAKYRQLIETMQDGVYRSTHEGKFLDVNPAMVKILGYESKEELMSIDIKSQLYFEPEDRESVELDQKFQEMAAFRLRKKDGSEVWVEDHGRFVVDDKGTILYHEGVLRDITDRKRAEDALKISEQKYRDIVTYAPVGIYQSTRDGGFLAANIQLAKMLGYDSVRELMQRDMATDVYWNPGEREKLIATYEPLGSANNLEVQWKKKDGTPLWVNLSSHVVKDSARQTTCFEGFAHDITERWLAEQALGSAYQQLEATLDALPDVMYEVDRDGRVLSYRAPEIENLSLAPDVFLGRPMTEVVPQHAGEVFSTALAEAAATGRHSGATYSLNMASGPRWYELSISRMEKQDAKTFHFIVLVRDITERKRAEAALRDSEQRFRTTLYSIGDGVITTDTTGTVRQMNRVAESLTGWSEQDACGQPIQQIFRIVDEETGRPVESPVAQVLRKGVVTGLAGQTVLVGKDGTRRPISDSGAPIKNPAGETTGVVLVFNDQTERRDLQAQLLQAQKMEAIGRLAGGIAHDFNNMIGVILGYAKLIETRLNPLDPLQKNVKAITGAAERSANLTKQLLAFARKQVIAPVPLNLNDSLSMLHKMLMRLVGEDITLTLLPGDNLWITKIDPTQVDQILANLSTNARDAIDDVGTITIETANTKIDQPLSKEQQDFTPGDYVMLAFSDTGTGMDKATQQRIFEPFFTTKPKGQGTGLGLATVFGIVKQNNGFIHVYSEPGKGSTFKIYLPRFQGEAEAPVQETKDVPLGGTETILIVEDEEQLLELSCAALEMHGYAVLSAKSPGEAIILCERTDRNIALLITDVVMPGMNGKELKDRLDTLKPGMKTIFMSGYTADVVAHRGILDEGVFFLQKPFTPLTLAKKVREVLNG